jgi:hypothetical protein
MRNARFATPTAGKRTGTTAPASHRADLAHHRRGDSRAGRRSWAISGVALQPPDLNPAIHLLAYHRSFARAAEALLITPSGA